MTIYFYFYIQIMSENVSQDVKDFKNLIKGYTQFYFNIQDIRKNFPEIISFMLSEEGRKLCNDITEFLKRFSNDYINLSFNKYEYNYLIDNVKNMTIIVRNDEELCRYAVLYQQIYRTIIDKPAIEKLLELFRIANNSYVSIHLSNVDCSKELESMMKRFIEQRIQPLCKEIMSIIKDESGGHIYHYKICEFYNDIFYQQKTPYDKYRAFKNELMNDLWTGKCDGIITEILGQAVSVKSIKTNMINRLQDEYTSLSGELSSLMSRVEHIPIQNWSSIQNIKNIIYSCICDLIKGGECYTKSTSTFIKSFMKANELMLRTNSKT